MAPPEIDSTPNSATGNSYVSLADFKSYLLARYPLPTYQDLTYQQLVTQITAGDLDTILSQVLISACEKLSNSLIWNGTVTTIEQALPFGREGLYHLNGELINPLTYPSEIKQAQMELGALYLSDDSLFTVDDAARSNLKSVKAGVEVTFQDSLHTGYNSIQVQSMSNSREFAYLKLPPTVLLSIPESWYQRSSPLDVTIGRRHPRFKVIG